MQGAKRMILFDNDYTEGAHEQILKRLVQTNREQAPGYGLDQYTKNAKKYIKRALERKDVDVHFISSGTQTNLTVIAAALRPYQGVISAASGHILTLEAGAIEATGHKILPLPSQDGKIYAGDIRELAKNYENDPANFHKVQPGMVYLSNPTEMGTLYSKEELKALKTVCEDYDMKLFIDGARLGYGLVAETNEVTLHDLTNLSDVFYIGGTKIGALFGEAVVINNKEIQRGFKTVMKQKGALLAKGRALGIQFEVLFEEGLYFEISKYAVAQAMRIKEALIDQGIQLKYEAYTNQLFPILNEDQIKQLQEKYSLLLFEEEDETNSVVRICTSWATASGNVDALIQDINKL